MMFPSTPTKFLMRFYSSSIFKNFSPSQMREFNDNLILVNDKDNQIGQITKIKAHLLSEKNQHPHRAFSAFLFNNKNELLIQQRSKIKVTFPLMWSNTCCSHPMNKIEESDTRNDKGIKIAVRRRMEFELGIKTLSNDFHLTGKILYRSKSNNIFEEYELDYLLLMQSDHFPLSRLNSIINRNEVADIAYVSKEELKEDMRKKDINYYTPWFRMIMEKKGDELFDFFPKKQYNLISSKDRQSIISFI